MDSLLDTANRVLPGGHFGNMAGPTLVEGQGAHVRDTEGREYIDYLLGSGPMFIGHAHPAVTAAKSHVCQPRRPAFQAMRRRMAK